MAGQGADLQGKSAGAARFVFLLTQGGVLLAVARVW